MTDATKMCPRMHFVLPLLRQQKQQILYGKYNNMETQDT